MSEATDSASQPLAGWRLTLGVGLFALSIIVPVAGMPTVAALDLSVSMTASISGGLLVGAELLGIVAVAVLGKPGYQFMKNRLFGFLKMYGPPQEVSRGRYTIGLVMFFIPVLFAWVSVYVADYIPDFTRNPLRYAIGGDLLLLAGLFVLGGDFWDKIKALFVYSDRICSKNN